MNRIKYIAGLFLLVILATGLSYPYSNLPAGGGGSGSGLPSGGTVGQLVINTAPGTGTWQDFNIPGNGIVQGILKLGTQSPDPLESQIYSARLLNDASGLGAGNSGHGFSDYTNITRTGTMGYGSFDSMCTISGVADYDHISGFQTRNIINIPGHTLGAWYGFHASGTFTAGTTTTRYGFYNIAPTITGGTITNNYAFFNSDPLANQQFSGFTAFGINATVDPLVQVKITGTVTASHDNDMIYGLYVNPTFADGGHSGVTHVGIYNGGTLWQTGNIGFTGNRVPYGYFTNLACTNTITGTTSGNLPLPAITYVLNAASVSPVIPAGGAKIKVFIGMNGSGTNTGLAQNCTINAPATGGTAVDGQEFEYWVLDDGTSTARTLTLSGFTALGVVLPATSNGAATQKFVVFNGKYAAAAWKVLGVSYE